MQLLSLSGVADGAVLSARPGRVRFRLAAAAGCSALAAIAASVVFTRALPARPATVPVRVASAAVRAVPLHPEAEMTSKRFTGRVGQNLTASLLAAGVPELQGRQYVGVLRRAIDLSHGLSVDDRFDLVLQRDSDGKLGQLLYIGLDRIARADVELLKWTDGKSMIWVNADGVGGEDSDSMRLPVQGRVSSRFGERFHPILGYVRFHAGIDLAASAGTPIVAAADGRVVGAGWHGGYGQQVEIAHGSGIETSYGHMSRIATRIGQVVRKGEVIGWVGSTGLSTGPHLHFEVTRNGRAVNPMTIKLGGGPGHLEGARLVAFQNELRGVLLAPAIPGSKH
jgi:murein DD-endopeptidase MepM/ murein hydrolase activator NlpD